LIDYNNYKSWPFNEAKKIVKRLESLKDDKKTIIFETGYGPSGLPHIGTFGEVLRTNMVGFVLKN
jgi:lysyl-tRNA synthetase class 1